MSLEIRLEQTALEPGSELRGLRFEQIQILKPEQILKELGQWPR